VSLLSTEAFKAAKSLATNIHYPFDVINHLFAVSVKTSRCRTVENTRCFDTLRFQRRQTTCKDCLTCIAIMINLPASQSPLTHYCQQLYLETYRDKIPLFYLSMSTSISDYTAHNHKQSNVLRTPVK